MRTSRIIATRNFKVRLIRKRKKCLSRLINAIGLLCHIVSGDFIGPGPTASADLPVFAPATFSLIAIGVAEILKDPGGGPYLPEGFLPNIPTVEFEIATGLNLAPMGDETEGDPSQASPGHRIEAMFF